MFFFKVISLLSNYSSWDFLWEKIMAFNRHYSYQRLWDNGTVDGKQITFQCTTKEKINLLEFHWIRKLNYFSISYAERVISLRRILTFHIHLSCIKKGKFFCRIHSTFLHHHHHQQHEFFSESLLSSVIWLILHLFYITFHRHFYHSYTFLNNIKNDIKYLYHNIFFFIQNTIHSSHCLCVCIRRWRKKFNKTKNKKEKVISVLLLLKCISIQVFIHDK